jgi:hypothetical protein
VRSSRFADGAANPGNQFDLKLNSSHHETALRLSSEISDPVFDPRGENRRGYNIRASD